MKFSLKALAVSLFLTFLPSLPATAQVMPEVDGPVSSTRLRAALIYQRIAGVKVPLDSQDLKDMEELMNQGLLAEASEIPTRNPNFLNVTVKHFASRMSTVQETVLAPMSDFVATVMGHVRDDINAKQLLTTDNIYVGDPQRVPNSVDNDIVDDIIRSNNHYEQLEREFKRNNFNVAEILIAQRQQTVNSQGNPVDLPDAAGVFTSRAYVMAHGVAGTNRRLAVHYPFRSFLCTDVTEWADTTLPSVRIGRDVDRAPGGEPSTFNTTCKGCHSPMDAMRGAAAHLDFEDGFVKHGLVLDRGNDDLEFKSTNQNPTIAEKYSNNADVEPTGWETTDASWTNNLFNFGSKASFFGWRNMPAQGQGVGMKRFGQMLADSRAFSTCMAKRVYRSVCKREATNIESNFINVAADEFEKDYNLRNLFQYVARSPSCIGS